MNDSLITIGQIFFWSTLCTQLLNVLHVLYTRLYTFLWLLFGMWGFQWVCVLNVGIMKMQAMQLVMVCTGADCHARDVSGKRPFEYIKDHEEWIDSGHFSDDTRALLKGLY